MDKDVVVQPDTISMKVEVHSPRVGVRSYLSSQFLRSAIEFRKQAQKIEDEHPGGWKDPWLAQHRDLVLSSVINAVTFFDSMINELFTDAAEDHGLEKDGYLAPLDTEAHRLMKAYWTERPNRRTPTITRYRMICTFGSVEPIESGGQVHQNARLAIDLRNALVHYTPRTMYTDDVHTLEKSLSDKYPHNALMPNSSGNPWWPDRALSAGAANWVIDAVTAYADECCARLGAVPSYQRLLRGTKAP